MSYYVSCIDGRGRPYGFEHADLAGATERADSEVSVGLAASADVLDSDDESVYYAM